MFESNKYKWRRDFYNKPLSNKVYYLIGVVISWVIGSLVIGAVGGSILWFAVNLLGADWAYFETVRLAIVGTLVIDMALDVYVALQALMDHFDANSY